MENGLNMEVLNSTKCKREFIFSLTALRETVEKGIELDFSDGRGTSGPYLLYFASNDVAGANEGPCLICVKDLYYDKIWTTTYDGSLAYLFGDNLEYGSLLSPIIIQTDFVEFEFTFSGDTIKISAFSC